MEEFKGGLATKRAHDGLTIDTEERTTVDDLYPDGFRHVEGGI
ncbi:MAG TPA: hypothetical protein VF898_03845 [Chloroflexota bacterium]